MVIQTKQELRQLILDHIKAQKEEVALFKSRVILEKMMTLPAFLNARTILFYASFKGEVDTFALMQKAMEMNKRVALPLVRKEATRITAVLIRSLQELKPGAYGILEPVDHKERRLDPFELDLIVVPGVAFDRHHNRLGRGAGYYDRFLSEVPATTPTIALAYDFQVVETLPGIEGHDRPVTHLLTD
ncbi:MAG: 5-formyltetrahydrofolate cyclo-ligase [Candidatus Omnitrophica bacterium]|nr:5-formyltetrahydrofolate cyclo-ligase [Candidatus Omnitrophota bacterium]